MVHGPGFISDVDDSPLFGTRRGIPDVYHRLRVESLQLWQLRRLIFWRRRGTGAVKSVALLAGLLMLTDFAWQAAVVGGIGLAMSSATAMALQLMREKGMNRSESGQLGFSVLLFQDLAAIPVWLVLVPLLAGSADEHFDWMIMKVLAFVGTPDRRALFTASGIPFLSQLLACGKRSPPRRCCWCWVPHCLWNGAGCRWRSVR